MKSLSVITTLFDLDNIPAELEKSTTSLVAIDAIRDVGGPKGKSPRRRIRKRMTVDYSTTENDNKSSVTTEKIRDLYGSPGALMEVNESSDRENEAEQPDLVHDVSAEDTDSSSHSHQSGLEGMTAQANQISLK